MPRHPANNPTERILRMIEEWMQVLEWLEAFDLPPRPATPAIDEEIIRQRLTKAHTESQREYRLRLHAMQQRKQRATVRELGRDHGLDVQSLKGLRQGLDDQLRFMGEDVPYTPAPEPRHLPRMTAKEKEIRDRVLEDLKKVERADLLRAAVKEGKLEEFLAKEATPKEVARADMERTQEMIEQAKGSLFKPQAGDE